MFYKLLSVLLVASTASAAVEVIQGGNYTLEFSLLPNETISVTATVKTQGWVGVGLSSNPDMSGADLIIGGVENGQKYVGDYFAIRNTRPVLDIVDNVLTSSATENATHTVLKFTRLSDTGDEMEDLPISRSTYVIWAYGDVDGVSYHGSVNRGVIPLSKFQ